MAGLDYDSIVGCFHNKTAAAAAMTQLDGACNKQGPAWFPYVVINGKATGSDDKDIHWEGVETLTKVMRACKP